MTRPYRVRIHFGPAWIDQHASDLRAVGFPDIGVGTEHIYTEVQAKDRDDVLPALLTLLNTKLPHRDWSWVPRHYAVLTFYPLTADLAPPVQA